MIVDLGLVEFAMAQRLVVVGNSMAGIRALENTRARRRDHLEITVFGDEPYELQPHPAVQCPCRGG